MLLQLVLFPGPGKISWKQHQNIEYWKESSTLLRWLSSTDNLHTWMEIHFNGCNDIKNENFTPFCNLKRYFIVETLKPDGILYTYLAIDKMGVNNFFKVILFWIIGVWNVFLIIHYDVLDWLRHLWDNFSTVGSHKLIFYCKTSLQNL